MVLFLSVLFTLGCIITAATFVICGLFSLIEGRPVLAWRWVAILMGAFVGLFPLNLRSVPFQGAELALRLFEGDPVGQRRLISTTESYSGGVKAHANLPGAYVKLTTYQTWRAVRAEKNRDQGIERAANEAAALAFAQSIINKAHKQETF